MWIRSAHGAGDKAIAHVKNLEEGKAVEFVDFKSLVKATKILITTIIDFYNI